MRWLVLAGVLAAGTPNADPEVSGVLVAAGDRRHSGDPRLGAITAGFARRGLESFAADDLARPPPDAERQLIRGRFRLDTARRARRRVRHYEAVAAADEAITIFERTASEPLHKELLVEAYVERGAAAFALGDAATAETVFLKALALDPLFQPDDVLFPADTIKLFADVSRFSRQLRYGTVSVVATVPGATVNVDFGSTQDAPYEVKVPDGHHFVSVRAPGRQEVVTRVRIRTERRVDLFVRPPLTSGGTADLERVEALDPNAPATITALATATHMRFVLLVYPSDENLTVTLYDGRTGTAVSAGTTTLSVDPTAREIDAAVDNVLRAMITTAPAIAEPMDVAWYETWWGWTIVGTVVVGAAVGTYVAVDNVDTRYRFQP